MMMRMDIKIVKWYVTSVPLAHQSRVETQHEHVHKNISIDPITRS